MKRVPGSSLSGDRFFFQSPVWIHYCTNKNYNLCRMRVVLCICKRNKKNLSVLHEFMRLKKNLQLIKLSHTYKNFAQTKICIAEYFVFHHHPWGSTERRFLASFTRMSFASLASATDSVFFIISGQICHGDDDTCVHYFEAGGLRCIEIVEISWKKDDEEHIFGNVICIAEIWFFFSANCLLPKKNENLTCHGSRIVSLHHWRNICILYEL